jgi:hypothetical protein
MGRAHHLLGVDEKLIQKFSGTWCGNEKAHFKENICRYGLDLSCSGWIPVIGFGQHNGCSYSVTHGKFC